MKINFKILASLTYYTVMEFMEGFFPMGGPGLRQPTNFYEISGLQSILYRQEELKLFYARDNFDFRTELFDMMQVFITLILRHIRKAVVDRVKQTEQT
jgi:hypothetical protein